MAAATMAADQQHAQLPELTREFTNSEKFFRYFQHEVTGISSSNPCPPSKSPATDAPTQTSKTKWPS